MSASLSTREMGQHHQETPCTRAEEGCSPRVLLAGQAAVAVVGKVSRP